MDDIVDISDLDVIDWLHSQIPRIGRSKQFVEEKQVPVVHYREGVRLEIGECTITRVDDPGILVESTIGDEAISGTITGNFDNIEEVEFPQAGLVIDDPQKHLNFVRLIAKKYHAASRRPVDG